MTAVQYPSYWNTSSQSIQAGPNLGWAYDTMGRLNTMTDLAAQASIISATTYNAANQMLTMSGSVNETRTYNAMLQLTGLTAPNVNLAYYYYNSVQNNNGKITSQVDMVTGEQVNYAYDALNRLASAATSYQANVPQWGQSYTYDGFGNLTAQTVTQGSAPAFSAVYDPSTNHPTGSGSVDANGNLAGVGGYDGFNRLIGTYGSFMYSYAPGNKRVWRGSGFTTGWVMNQPMWTTDEITFWSVSGQKLATYQIVITGGLTGIGSASAPTEMYASQTGTNYYFGRKLIKNAGGYVGADRLGSIGHFYPWGQEKPSATQNGTEKFTGYFRDAETGLDYANQRYHNPGTGRFLTPDPYVATSSSATSPTDPGSWDRYAYVGGDPINRKDPTGQDWCDVDDWTDDDCFLDSTSYPGPDPNLGIELAATIAAELEWIQQGSTPGSASFQQDCNQILTLDITAYLGSYDGGTAPLNTPGNIALLVSDGMTYDVDPRFIVALAIAESQGGQTNKGPYNAWNIGSRNPPYPGNEPYTSWSQSINGINSLIAGPLYFGSDLTNTSAIYKKYDGENAIDPKTGKARWMIGLTNLNTALGQMQGKQNLLTDPCNSTNPRSPNQ